MSTISEDTYLNRKILEVINEKKPQSVKQLAKILKETLDLEEEEIVRSILKLKAEGIIKLENQINKSWSLGTYLKTSKAIWYWMTIAAAALTSGLAFTVTENLYPWTYARNFMGIIFVLFLPGYTFLRVLFRGKTSKVSRSNFELAERLALSIGMSFGLVSIVGLVLYYSPFDLNLITMLFSLLGLTLVFSTAGVILEYQGKKTELQNDSMPLSGQ